MSKNMKTLLINLIVICFFCNSLFATEIELSGIKLYDDILNIDNEKFPQNLNREKCKKNHCTYKFKYKVEKNKVKYWTNYELATNEDNKIISILAYLLDTESLNKPERFIQQSKFFNRPYCAEQISWSIDYWTEKYKVSRKDFITTHSKANVLDTDSLSNYKFEYPDVLFHQHKIYMDSKKKIFETYCRYSRSDNGKWIMAIIGSKLMTKDYHDAFEKNFPKKKIDKFDANEIVSYLFPSSY